MKKIIYLLTFLILISCSDDSDINEPSSITYKIEGVGEALEIQLRVNQMGGDTNPRSSSSIKLENIPLPYTYSIEEFYPDQMEIFLSFYINDSSNYPTQITFIKDGEIIKEYNTFDDPSYWNDGTVRYSFNYEWGVFED